jgi:hypothetical protein
VVQAPTNQPRAFTAGAKKQDPPTGAGDIADRVASHSLGVQSKDDRVASHSFNLQSKDDRVASHSLGTQSEEIKPQALYTAEHKAREEIDQKVKPIEKEQREEELRKLAAHSRMARADVDDDGPRESEPVMSAGSGSDMGWGDMGQGGEHDELTEEERVAKQQRDKLQVERRKEIERDMRKDSMKGASRENKLDRDGDGDISEKIALGVHVGSSKLTGDEVVSQLFNQGQGVEGGFGAADEYDLNDKGVGSNNYRPSGEDFRNAPDGDQQLKRLQNTDEFRLEDGLTEEEQRDKLRIDEGRKEIERDMRKDNMKGAFRKNKLDRDGDGDISEKIALGMHVELSKLTGDEVVDSQLFNQGQGVEGGFGAADEYDLNDKGVGSNIYRPSGEDFRNAPDGDQQLKRLQTTDKFRAEDGLTEEEQRDKLRIERRKEIERDMRKDSMKGAFRKNKLDRHGDGDISEKVALGMHVGSSMLGPVDVRDTSVAAETGGEQGTFGELRRALDAGPYPMKLVVTAGSQLLCMQTKIQCELITRRLGVVHVSPCALFEEAAAQGNDLVRHLADCSEVPDEVMLRLVKERVSRPDYTEVGWLLEGFPPTAAQALARAGIKPDVFVCLDVPLKIRRLKRTR